ncbi:unnamed protein product [Didymodactylos carnosus]|uniref:Thioredoxin domain-containing protein n=1 Tax=Didymodactylos carnosus TaxID=1234261 RepID=A0A814E340_9BILA|nr:unnamed protein product [Didymodactylos carnosus]CAF0966454.1 unnamed protein product [Didymodactylos carnosus]CAF3552356.1 unnamed protein product [Didymodactylos carnosus]CAF3739966.1 unnamed protein product [Didymodactylos carnosus]
MLFPVILDLSYDQDLPHVNFLRVDVDNEANVSLAQRFRITNVPMVCWYFQGKKLDELVGADIGMLTKKTHQLAQN